MPEGAVYVGRPTRWGNPFVVGEPALVSPLWNARTVRAETPEHSVRLYKAWLVSARARCEGFIPELRGKDLVCWCPLDQPCHADVLLEWANAPGGAE